MAAERIDAECVFCRIASGDAPATFVRRSPVVDIIEPIGPHAPGHVLVIPTWHVQDATTDPRVTAAVMSEAATYAASVGPCNVITSVGVEATQSVFHLHVHVVPRGAMDGLPDRWPWIGDSAEAARLREERDGAREQRDDLCELVDVLREQTGQDYREAWSIASAVADRFRDVICQSLGLDENPGDDELVFLLLDSHGKADEPESHRWRGFLGEQLQRLADAPGPDEVAP